MTPSHLRFNITRELAFVACQARRLVSTRRWKGRAHHLSEPFHCLIGCRQTPRKLTDSGCTRRARNRRIRSSPVSSECPLDTPTVSGRARDDLSDDQYACRWWGLGARSKTYRASRGSSFGPFARIARGAIDVALTQHKRNKRENSTAIHTRFLPLRSGSYLFAVRSCDAVRTCAQQIQFQSRRKRRFRSCEATVPRTEAENRGQITNVRRVIRAGGGGRETYSSTLL